VNAWRAAHRANAKARVFGHYGRSCACCGSTTVLSIDHANGGGGDHRRALFGSDTASLQFWRWLIAQGFPDGYQTLCRRCNASKGTGPACRMHAAA
jgi:hypothetical protein